MKKPIFSKICRPGRVVILFLFLLAFPLDAFSQPRGMGPFSGMGMNRWRGEMRCWKASDLNLSQEQTKALDPIQQSFFREAQLLRAQLFAKRLELRELLINPNTKVETIRSKFSEILEHQTKFEEKSIEYLIKIRAILTVEQLKNWCPEMEFPAFQRMIQGPESMAPMPPRRSPFQEDAKPE